MKITVHPSFNNVQTVFCNDEFTFHFWQFWHAFKIALSNSFMKGLQFTNNMNNKYLYAIILLKKLDSKKKITIRSSLNFLISFCLALNYQSVMQ